MTLCRSMRICFGLFDWIAGPFCSCPALLCFSWVFSSVFVISGLSKGKPSQSITACSLSDLQHQTLCFASSNDRC